MPATGTRDPGRAPRRTRISALRPFTTRLFNPLARRFAGRLPWFAIVRYTGRRSGRTYRTPLNVFRAGDRYVFALTYGADVDWVRNILAAGRCSMRTRGRDVELVEPELVVDPRCRLVPFPVRVAGRLIGVTQFLTMRAV